MRVKAKSFKDFEVWQKAHSLVLDIYSITRKFPKEKTYGFVSQLRRAAISIPANISECFARKSLKDKLRFDTIASGSLNEVNYYLLLSKELNYSNDIELSEKADEIGKMLISNMNSNKNTNY